MVVLAGSPHYNLLMVPTPQYLPTPMLLLHHVSRWCMGPANVLSPALPYPPSRFHAFPPPPLPVFPLSPSEPRVHGGHQRPNAGREGITPVSTRVGHIQATHHHRPLTAQQLQGRVGV